MCWGNGLRSGRGVWRVKGECLKMWTSICVEPLPPKRGMLTQPPTTWGLKEVREDLCRESTVTVLTTKQPVKMFNMQPKGDTLFPLSTPKDTTPFHYQIEMAFYWTRHHFVFLRKDWPLHWFDSIPKNWLTTSGCTSPFPRECVAKLGVPFLKASNTRAPGSIPWRWQL